MFLRSLNETQKELFLDLATQAANANDVVEENEKALLESYVDEMGIEVTAAKNLPLDELLTQLHNLSTQLEMNQVMFELVGMMMSDSEYDEKEKDFIKKVAEHFEIGEEKIKTMYSYVNEYSELIRKINVLMFE